MMHCRLVLTCPIQKGLNTNLDEKSGASDI